MRWIAVAVVVVGGLFLGGVAARPAAAGLLDFQLGSCAEVLQPCALNADEGASHLDFVTSGLDLGTAGTIGGSPADLYVKDVGAGDIGLGLAADTSGVHEISPGELVTLDLSQLAAHGITAGTLTVESLDAGEVGLITDATGPHTIAEVGSSLTASAPIAFSTASPFVTLTAASGSVLAAADVEVSVPEPPLVWLMLCGVAGGLTLYNVMKVVAP